MKRPAGSGGRPWACWLMSRIAGCWKVQVFLFRCRYGGREPAVRSSVASAAGLIHLGMDTSKDTIVVAVLLPGEDSPAVDRIANEEAAVRRLVGRFADRSVLRSCYEAGPGGYELFRLLASMGVACDVVAPSLVPKGGSDKVKTDRRDSRRLARLHRAGELTAIRVPSPAEEAVRDLVRVRAGLLADRRRAQQRLGAVLMRHGRVWRGGSSWTAAHRAWIAAQRFGEPALVSAVGYYQATLATREAELAAVEAELMPWAGREPLAPAVARLGCYRGIASLTGLTLAAEVVDWRRFPAARAFMGWTGLVPAEYSSGERTRRGHITKAGSEPVRTALTEAAWAYRHRPAIGTQLRRRQAGAAPATVARSWTAQRRLHARYQHLLQRKAAPEAAVAVARELAGFIWAEMTAEAGQPG
jgi:transposase